MEESDESTVFRQSVKESIKKSEETVINLSSQLQNVNSAIGSVKTSSTNAKKVIEGHFEEARNQVIVALDNRMVFLLATIKDIESKDLDPLRKTFGDLSKIKTLITKGQNVLEEEDELVMRNKKEIAQ